MFPTVIQIEKASAKTSTQRIGKYAKPKNYKKLEERTIKKSDRKTTQPDGRVVYEKDFGRRVGTKGKDKLRVVVDPIKNKIVASFPEEQFITSQYGCFYAPHRRQARET